MKILIAAMLAFTLATTLPVGFQKMNDQVLDEQGRAGSSDCTQNPDLSEWVGEYESAEAPVGLDYGGYVITIYEVEDEYYAHIVVYDRMLDARMRALVQGTETKVTLIFDTYLHPKDDRPIDTALGLMSGFENFKKGDKLLSLEKGEPEVGQVLIATENKMQLYNIDSFRENDPAIYE